MAPTKKPASIANPAGLSARDVGQIFEDLGSSSDEARARYDELGTAPDLAFADFLRWCMAHWPAPSPRWARDFFSFWRQEGREAIPHAEAVSLFTRLGLKPDPDVPGRLEGLCEDDLTEAFAPFFAEDFAPFRAIYRERLARADWHPDVCHAFWLVDWLLGEDVPKGEVEQLGRLCAHEHYSSSSYTPRHLEPLIRRAGIENSANRTLGLALLGMDGWRAALQALMDSNPDWSPERVADVLDAMPLGAAVALLREAEHAQNVDMAQAYADFVHRRPEPAEELLRVARELSAQEPRPDLAELLCLAAARRLLDAGEPVPDELDELLTLTLRYRAPLPLYRAVLPRLPRERRLALIERDLANPESRGVAIVALTDDELVVDGALLRRVLAHPRFDALATGQLGARGAQVIDEVLGRAIETALRPRLEHALLEAAATHVQAGGTFAESWSFYLILSPPLSEAAEALYNRLPEPLRSNLLVEAVREYRVPAEVLDLVARSGLRDEVIDDFITAYRARDKSAFQGCLPGRLAVLSTEEQPPDTFTPDLERFRAQVARGPDPKEPVYVCQIIPAGLAGPATSLTLLGGPPPVAANARPRSSRHVLTVDLHDAPELGSRFPGARAVSLFVPRDPDLDEDPPDAFFWRAWTESQVTSALAGLAKRPRTLVVHRCSVPSSTFAGDGDSAIRAALVRFPGYLLGGPLTIQQDTASNDPTFMAQLSEDFDLPLGDAGLLYSYTDEAMWDCH